MKTQETVYSTVGDYVGAVVLPALGDWSDDFDSFAIASEMLSWHVDDTNAMNNGFVERNDVEFWDIVRKHDISQ